MTSRNGATIAWTSYNLPSSLSAAGYTASFNYAPDRRRWRQIATYSGGTETTIYVAGLVEKLTTAARVHWKHRIAVPAGEVQVVRRSDGTNEVLYITTDHLGSTDTVTDASATVLARESFGAWGARRAANWQGNPSSAEWQSIANTTRRGYTGHEHLDNVLLVHMNGRVYDPAIGRFMSADPYVDGAETTQRWNRFSYVHNGPVVLTDPSGFEKAGGEFNRKTLPVSPGWDPSLSDGIRERIIVEAMRWSDFLDLADNLRDLKVLADLAFGSGGDGAGGGGNDGSERDNKDWKCYLPELGGEGGVDSYSGLGSSISFSLTFNPRTGQFTGSVSLGFGVGAGFVGHYGGAANFSVPSSSAAPSFGGGVSGTAAVYFPFARTGTAVSHQFFGSNTGSTTLSVSKATSSTGAAFANININGSGTTPALYTTTCERD